MFLEFQFNYGYAESSRIVSGPSFIYPEGFDHPLDALESFRKVLEAFANTWVSKQSYQKIETIRRISAADDVTQKILDEAVSRLEKEERRPDSGDVLEAFNKLWMMTADDVGASGFRDILEEHGWAEAWEYETSAEEVVIFQASNRWFLESPGWEGTPWHEAVGTLPFVQWSGAENGSTFDLRNSKCNYRGALAECHSLHCPKHGIPKSE
jgi:hypothetical protein